ncbi:MAG TPA: hypothetical protein VK535_02530 [Gemmatimonadales bacterium]|nr:hypothetical protein [Gemmatimonadales bacterium]
MNRSLRAGLVGSLLATSAVLLAGCTDDFVSGPQKFNGSVQLRNWADTLVMGDRRMVAARVLDEQSREVLDRTLDWTVVDPSLLSLSVSTTGDGDSVRLTALLPGTTTVGVHFLDAVFEEESQSQAVSVVLAGVQLTGAAVTLTAAGDSAAISATALAHDSVGVNVAVAGQGLTWTHHGSAVSLTGGGDLIWIAALQDGVDTLVVTHPVCLAGGACADTVVVTVAIPVDPIAGPTPGADVLVFNDVDMWSSSFGSGPENLTLFGNIVGFAGGGSRVSGHTVMFYTGAESWCGEECSTATSPFTDALGGRLVELGYAIVNETGSLATIPADVKVIFILLPMATVPVEDVNGLKQFAGQGGRVVVVGENQWVMGTTGLAAENQLLQDLGAQLTNQGGCLVNSGEYAQAEGTHQMVTGLTQILMACASPMIPGPDDFVLFRAPTGEVVGAVAKIDLTPLPI